MATVFRVLCESSDQTTELEITDSFNPIPGSDTWRALDPDAWGEAGGAVASWGTNFAHLHAGTSGAVAVLDGFTKNTQVRGAGTGDKSTLGGTFPDGSFSWTCINRN